MCGDGPPGFDLLMRQRLREWADKNADFFARSAEPLDEAVAVVMTGALMLAVAEVSLGEDAAHARRLADGVLEVLSGVGPRVPGVTSRLTSDAVSAEAEPAGPAERSLVRDGGPSAGSATSRPATSSPQVGPPPASRGGLTLEQSLTCAERGEPARPRSARRVAAQGRAAPASPPRWLRAHPAPYGTGRPGRS